MTTVEVYFNDPEAVLARGGIPGFSVYEPGDVLHGMGLFFAPEDLVGDAAICDYAFRLFNEEDRANAPRLMAVGDVVVIDGRPYAVAPTGFESVEVWT